MSQVAAIPSWDYFVYFGDKKLLLRVLRKLGREGGGSSSGGGGVGWKLCWVTTVKLLVHYWDRHSTYSHTGLLQQVTLIILLYMYNLYNIFKDGLKVGLVIVIDIYLYLICIYLVHMYVCTYYINKSRFIKYTNIMKYFENILKIFQCHRSQWIKRIIFGLLKHLKNCFPAWVM